MTSIPEELPAADDPYRTFMRLFTRHEGALRCFVRTLLPTWDDVDEVMQDVSIAAWTKFGRFDPQTDFARWAATIARYEVLNYRSTKARDRLVFDEDLILLLADEGQEDGFRESIAMNAFFHTCRSMPHCTIYGVLLSMALLAMPKQARAICGLDGAVREQLRSIADPKAARALSRKSHLSGSCTACHLGRFGGPRNEYGNAINTLLTLRDRDDPVRQREVGRRMKDILANPSLPNSPTFGELFQQGRFPASSLANQEPATPEVIKILKLSANSTYILP